MAKRDSVMMAAIEEVTTKLREFKRQVESGSAESAGTLTQLKVRV